MIDSTIFFKSEKGNSYLYDSNTKELLNIHPVVVMIHELNKQISKQELNKRIIAKYPYYKKIWIIITRNIIVSKKWVFLKKEI